MGGTGTNQRFNHLKVTDNSHSHTAHNSTKVLGNLTIHEGTLSEGCNGLDVDGNCVIESGGVLNCKGCNSGATAEFGSMTINNGGHFKASQGTTTIKSRTSGGYSWYAPNAGSTFTHNNGLVKFTLTDWGGASETYWHGTGWYNLEIAGTSSEEFRYDDVSGGGLTVYNNFTITQGRVRFNAAGDAVTVHGITKMVDGQYGNTGTAPSGVHNYNGSVEIHAGTLKVTSGTCNMESIRKLGGTLA